MKANGQGSKRRGLPALVALVALLAGCGGAAEEKAAAPKAPETVDVAPSPSVPTTGDIQAAPPRKGLTGVLPSDFPKGLPIYLPSSIIDFGKKGGSRFVVLQTPDGRAGVESWLRQAAVAAGYQVSGKGGRLSLAKGGRSFTLQVSGQDTSEFRYEY